MRIIVMVACSLAALSQAGCPECVDEGAVLLADFEDCEGACGFVAIATSDGSPEDAEAWVAPTVHPGENGLFLRGSLSVVGSINVDIEPHAGLWPRIELVTTCPDGVALFLESLDTDSYRLTLSLSPREPGTAPDYYARVVLPWPESADQDDLVELDELAIDAPEGTCVVDEIRVAAPGEC